MKLLSLDTETTIVDLCQDRKCRDQFNVPDLVTFQWWSGDQGSVHMWDEIALEDSLSYWIQNRIIVGQNLPFDILVLCKQFPSLEPLWRQAINEGRVLDTMVLAHLREPCIKSKSLASLVEYHLGKELSGKGDTQLSFTRDRPLTEEQRRYALEDAKITLELAEYLRSLPLGSVMRDSNMKRHRMTCKEVHNLPSGKAGFHPLDHVYSSCFVNTRCWSEPIGWDLDMDKLEKHRAEGRKTIDECIQVMSKHGIAEKVRDTGRPAHPVPVEAPLPRKWTLYPDGSFYRDNKGRAEQQPARWKINQKTLRKALKQAATDLDLRDYPISKKTKKISTEYKYWKLYKDQLPEGLQAFLNHSKAHKYESLYFAPWTTSRTGRAYPSFFIPGTETLRHASRKPNLHQIAKHLREIFYVKDHVIIGADYSALECYTLCHTLCALGIQGPLYDTLDANGDMHSLTAARMLGGSETDYPKGSDERQAAKALNFGIPGGLGVKKMYAHGRQVYGLDWSRSEAAELYVAWLEAYSDVAEYLQRFKDVGPWELKPPNMSKAEWIRYLGFERCPSVWDLNMKLDKGRIYNVQLPSGARIPARNYTQGTNCAFQHLGAVATSHAINACFAANLPVIAAVHDWIGIVLLREGLRPPWKSVHTDAADQLEQIMSEALHETCPLAPKQKVEAEIHDSFF